MAQSDLNGERKSRRYETTFKEYMVEHGITNDLPAAVKMEKLKCLFDKLARPTRMISDNLQPGTLQERVGATEISGMQKLLEANEHAVDLLHDCVEEMARCPLSLVNGTSEAFAQCNKLYVEEAHRLDVGRKELSDYIRQQCGTVANDMQNVTTTGDSDKTSRREPNADKGLSPLVACAMIQVASIFLVIEEMIAA